MRITLTVVLLSLLAAPALAAPPTNCTYPAPPDAIQSYVAGTIVKPVIDQHGCILGKLMTRSLKTPPAETVCTSVTVQPGVRLPVIFTASTAFVGSEPAPTLQVTDNVTPPTLAPDGVLTPSGTTVTGYVMNHHLTTAHTGKACVIILRP